MKNRKEKINDLLESLFYPYVTFGLIKSVAAHRTEIENGWNYLVARDYWNTTSVVCDLALSLTQQMAEVLASAHLLGV